MAVVAAVSAAWAAPGAWVHASEGARTTGDEPQYLMTALSLAEDADLDISDERAEARWAPFHEAGPPLVQEDARAGERRVSPHDPLLPAVLAGPMALGGWLAAKLTLALMLGALAAVLVWTAVRRLSVPPGLAALATLAFSMSAPLAVYGTQVYPELPAALAVAVAAAALLGPAAPRRAAVVATAVVALPWLSVKYAPVAGVLAVLVLAGLARAGYGRWAVGVAAGLVLAGAAYLVAHHAWYGGWTVYAAGDHFTAGELMVMGRDPEYASRSVRLIGLLTDRGFGLAAWQPAYLLALPALGALARRRPRAWPTLTLPLAAGWLTATFAALTMHGWWWPGRQAVVVLPLVVLLVAWWAGTSIGARRALAAVGALGVASFAVLVGEGLADRLTLVVDFERSLAPTFRALHGLLPDYRDPTAATWLRHGGWLVAAGALSVAGWRTARSHHPEPAAPAPSLGEPVTATA